MKRTIFCVALILCAAIMAGCAVQAPGRVQSPISAQTELPQMRKADDAAEIVTALLPQMEEKTEGGADAPLPIERANASENTDNTAEKQPTDVETAPPTTPEQVAIPTPASEDTPAPAPTPAPAQKPAEKQEEQPTPEPAPTPKPAASGNIYSIAEAIQAGNEYARAQYGVTIDTSMTAADSSYFPGMAGGERRAGGTDRRGAWQCRCHLRLPRRHGRRGNGQRVCAVQLHRSLRCSIG